MATGKDETCVVKKLGEQRTSDLIVRLRTTDGRDDWIYSHSSVLSKKSKYFSIRLSDEQPHCHTVDSRKCIELICKESDVDYHVTLLRLLYVDNNSVIDMCHNVKNALGILKAAKNLGCNDIVAKCVQYIEAVPWEENEEEEILTTIPRLGEEFLPILARLLPVDTEAIVRVFLSAVWAATLPGRVLAEPPAHPLNLKTSAQEQVEYMLAEDDDAPLLVADEQVKMEVKKCFLELFKTFKVAMMSLLHDDSQLSEDLVLEKSSDLVWASRVLPKLSLLPELVMCWGEATDDIIEVLDSEKLKVIFWETKLKILEITGRVIEAVGYGSVIIPSSQRTHLVKVWLPYIRKTKPLLDLQFSHEKVAATMDGELCQSMEAAFVSLVLSLPSGDQAEILASWLQTDEAQFPDLSEAFEVWCYRTKAAKRRLSVDLNSLGGKPVSSVGV